MDKSLLNKIKDVLQRKRLVYFSEGRIDYDPECKFFSHSYYEVMARCLYGAFGKRGLNKKAFLKKVSKKIYNQLKDMEMSNKLVKFKSKNAANQLSRIPRKCVKPLSDAEITSIKAELTQKFRNHCCPDLDYTDNDSRRYFCRLPIVYVRKLNTYVLTNCRKYIHNQEKDEYRLDNTIKYEILDYCPFCGEDLRCLRIPNGNRDEIIKDAINKWRDFPETLLDDNESSVTQITFYGINFYDSIEFISNVLASKYGRFDDNYGVDETGVMYPGAKFITVKKMFELADKYDLLGCFDISYLLSEIHGREVPAYFYKKFIKRSKFSDDELLALERSLISLLKTIYYQPEYFDELLENNL